jgi:hypothetical protein
MANMPGTMFPGTIVPILLELPDFCPIITTIEEQHSLTILTCPGCGRGGLRIPNGRRGKVTCPRCGAEWFYPETIELNEVEFRCSQTGARFIVQLMRRSPLHKFVVQGIKNAPPRTSQSLEEDLSTPASKIEAIESQNAPLDRITGAKPGRWLARMFGMGGVPTIPDSVSIVEKVTSPVPAPNSLRFDANEYNWTSFFCPYCNASSFIKCGVGHLVCDSTIEMRNGRRFHQCFCGNAGFIEGTIKIFEANQRTIENPNVTCTNPTSAIPSKEVSTPTLSPPAKKTDKSLLP